MTTVYKSGFAVTVGVGVVVGAGAGDVKFAALPQTAEEVPVRAFVVTPVTGSVYDVKVGLTIKVLEVGASDPSHFKKTVVKTRL